jgi:hypothetical protein
LSTLCIRLCNALLVFKDMLSIKYTLVATPRVTASLYFTQHVRRKIQHILRWVCNTPAS